MACGCGGQKIVVPQSTAANGPPLDFSTMPRVSQSKADPAVAATNNARAKTGARRPCTYLANTWAPIPGAC